MRDTIFALSSGRLPAAIAVVRVSGPGAAAALAALAGPRPGPPRRAALRTLRAADGGVLDRALVLFFPGSGSATGEDLVEFHLHGGRAVVAAVEGALAALPSLRGAEPGEFTRRALTNGRVDLAQAEGLADLLAAETEGARRAAMAMAEGAVGRLVRGWIDRLLMLSAMVEASLDFSDEDEVGAAVEDRSSEIRRAAAALAAEMAAAAAAPPAERLRDGIRVTLAGPPNAGKSTLLNLLGGREAAIVSPVSGTTRDVVEVPVTRGGVAWLLSDTAGLTDTTDPVERIGVARARSAAAAADLLLWLGDDPPPVAPAFWIFPRADDGRPRPAGTLIAVRQDDPASVDALWTLLTEQAGAMLPPPDQPVLGRRQLALASEAAAALRDPDEDPLILAEQLRSARRCLLRITGADATEAVLDALFGRFCIGK